MSSDLLQKHVKHHPQQPHYNHHRPKFAPPVFWERPYFPSWDPNVHYQVNYHTQDDSYFDDYYNRQLHNDCCRYDSDVNLNASKTKILSSPTAAAPPPLTTSNCGAIYCSNRFYTKPPPLHPCYSCERSSSSQALTNAAKFNNNKVQKYANADVF